MRIAAIYDIHGNRPALEAVLRDIERESVDVILVGGDVAWGPFPRETVELLHELDNARFIRGNADREVAHRLGVADGLDDVTSDINAWAAGQLTKAQRMWLSGLHTAFITEVDGIGETHFCHGSPRSDEEPITPLSPQDRLDDALADVPERTIMCGHTHIQFELEVGEHEVINAGSVGLPYEGEPGAYWALLGPDVHLRKTDYDVDAATASMERSACPHVYEVFIDTILRPPSADETARKFEKIATQKAY